MKKLSGREGMATEWVEPEVPEKEMFSSSQNNSSWKDNTATAKKRSHVVKSKTRLHFAGGFQRWRQTCNISIDW